MRTRDGLHDEQAQSDAVTALLLTAPQRLEHRGQELGRDRFAMVVNADLAAWSAGPRRHRDGAAGSTVAHRIGHEIADELRQAIGKELGGDVALTRFVRFQCGEGIEKPVGDDFAAEVAKMAGG